MVKVTIEVDPRNLQNFSGKIEQIKQKGLNYTAQGLLAQLQKNSPVDTGLLRSWFFAEKSDSEVKIRTPAQYAPFVNDGTGIYGPNKTPIYSAVGHPFAFQVNGEMIYTNVIQGQKGQHFVERSISETEAKISQFYIKAIQEVLN